MPRSPQRATLLPAKEEQRAKREGRAWTVGILLGLIPGLGVAATADWKWEPIAGGRKAEVTPSVPGRIGFTFMPSAQTGLHFTNRVDDRLIMENNNFMEGAGVALGDVDGDGWCDLYFCAIDGVNALYRNRGDWVFEDITARAGVGGGKDWHSTGAVFADIDGDGILDLLVNTLGQGTHGFRNLGKGRFRDVTEEAGLTSRTGSLGMALADIDGDGDLDLYVANYGTLAILRAGGKADLKQIDGKWQVTGPYADRLRFVDGRLEEVGEPDALYRNDGRGHFERLPWNSEWFRDEEGQPMAPPWDFGLGVQMRDVNEDGLPDIYVCNDFQTVDRLWLNDGRGRFRLAPKAALRHQSFASMGVDFADLDRDGRLDFFVVEMLSREHARRMTQVGGMRPMIPYPGRFENRPEVARNTLFWNRGDGTYAEIANFSGVDASEWSWQPVFLDVDLDGYEDLLVANGNAFDVQDRDTLNRVRALGRQTPEQTRTNILLYPRLLTPNAAFRNRGDLTFEEIGRSWGFDSRQVSHGIALADLDHDGDLDVVVNCFDAPPLLYRNDAAAPRVAVRLRGKAPNVQGIGAKIKLLGGAVPVQSQELVCGGRYLSGDDPMRVFAAGSPANRLRLEVTWRNGQRSVVDPVRFNCVYELDESASRPASNPEPTAPASPAFAEVSSRLQHRHHEEIFDDYSRQPLLMKQLSSLGPGVAWLDLNGDGHDDLFIGSGKGGQLAAFQGDGKGGFVPFRFSSPPTFEDDLSGLAGSVGPDGRRRLLTGLAAYERTAKDPTTAWAWTWDERQGRITGAAVPDLPAFGSSCGPLAVADYDGDGRLDLFLGGRVIPGLYPRPASSRLYRQRKGRWILDETNQPLLQDVGLVSGAVWSDLNGDGFPELVLACEWGPVKVFYNQKGKLSDVTRPLGLADVTGWWTSVTSVDLDGDGRLDLVAGNWGLNSSDHATPQVPVRLYYGDLGGRGVLDLIETDYAPELQAVVPCRSLSALSQAAPLLAQIYPAHAAFGAASVGEMIRRLQVHAAEARATTLASTIFFNRGDHFQAVPLPREAQWAPVFGLAAADLDGDGLEDLFLAQNFFARRLELPRLDAGRSLWLRNVGGGKLEPVPGQVSGLILYGEQRGAAVSDFNEDGRVDLVVTQNGAETKLFENVSGKPGLRVRLRGPPGNPDGVGAVLRPIFGRRPGPAREIHAGSGYWSQDGAVQVLGGAEAPTQVRVQWPGGKASSRLVAPGAREIAIDFER